MTTMTTAPLHIIGHQRVLDIRGNPGKLGYVRTGDLFVTDCGALVLMPSGHLHRAPEHDALLAHLDRKLDEYDVQEDFLAGTRDGF